MCNSRDPRIRWPWLKKFFGNSNTGNYLRPICAAQEDAMFSCWFHGLPNSKGFHSTRGFKKDRSDKMIKFSVSCFATRWRMETMHILGMRHLTGVHISKFRALNQEHSRHQRLSTKRLSFQYLVRPIGDAVGPYSHWVWRTLLVYTSSFQIESHGLRRYSLKFA